MQLQELVKLEDGASDIQNIYEVLKAMLPMFAN